MGEFLIVPLVVIALLAGVAVVYAAGATRREKHRLDSLPDDPEQREQAELDYLRREHAEADPARTRHPARRP